MARREPERRAPRSSSASLPAPPLGSAPESQPRQPRPGARAGPPAPPAQTRPAPPRAAPRRPAPQLSSASERPRPQRLPVAVGVEMKAARFVMRSAGSLSAASVVPREVELFSRYSPSPLSMKQLLDFGELGREVGRAAGAGEPPQL